MADSRMYAQISVFPSFFFNDTATTEIYTLSLHDALPISSCGRRSGWRRARGSPRPGGRRRRSEEHTSELQSRLHLVCRLLLEKQKPHSNKSPESRRSPKNSKARKKNKR